MTHLTPDPGQIQATITGDVSGQIAVGQQIQQTQNLMPPSPTITDADLASLKQLFENLRLQITAMSPPEKQSAALERLDELEETVVSQKPDLSTMEYVKNWFIKNLPTISGAVTSVVIHPIVGKIVEASGEMLAADFCRRFGKD